MAERRRVSVARLCWTTGAVLVMIVVAAAAVLLPTDDADPPETMRFPAVDEAGLSPLQTRVVAVLHAQFDAQPVGETYSEGVTEPWCADFVSWVMREAGAGLVNPHSGSWRVPGVYTLEEVYQAAGRFEEPDYSPAVGDVALYAEDSPMGLHANVVVVNDGATVTTVGGNEAGAIRIGMFDAGADMRLLGYGRLV